MCSRFVSVYLWPKAQKCFECENGLECTDNEKGIITGISNHPFAICAKAENNYDGINCNSFIKKEECT